jgi:hypothetical protein
MLSNKYKNFNKFNQRYLLQTIKSNIRIRTLHKFNIQKYEVLIIF